MNPQPRNDRLRLTWTVLACGAASLGLMAIVAAIFLVAGSQFWPKRDVHTVRVPHEDIVIKFWTDSDLDLGDATYCSISHHNRTTVSKRRLYYHFSGHSPIGSAPSVHFDGEYVTIAAGSAGSIAYDVRNKCIVNLARDYVIEPPQISR